VHPLGNSTQLRNHAHRHRAGDFLDEVRLRYFPRGCRTLSAIFSTWGRSASAAAGPKPSLLSFRILVCSGGSMKIIHNSSRVNEFLKLVLLVHGKREQHPAGTLGGKSGVFCNRRAFGVADDCPDAPPPLTSPNAVALPRASDGRWDRSPVQIR
jgi:hypothetical protein